MLNTTEIKFSIVYTIIVLAQLIFGVTTTLIDYNYFIKPAIVTSLVIFFISQSSSMNKPIRLLIVLALIFSLVGDIALLFDEINPTYFIVGLGSFLLAHVMYVLAFLKQRNPAKRPFVFGFIMLAYASALFYLLKDSLGDLLLPVSVYMIVILGMSTSAFLRHKMVNTVSFNWVFIGALLFMVSDSILAIDKFYVALPLSSVSIMSTYALAQYCIVIGILKHNSNSR